MSDNLNARLTAMVRARARDEEASLTAIRTQRATTIFNYGWRSIEEVAIEGQTSLTFMMWQASLAENPGNAIFFEECPDTRAIAEIAIGMFAGEGLEATYDPVRGITVSLR